MPVSSYCKKHHGQQTDCDRCPGPGIVLGIEITCTCKCHEKKGKDK